MAARLDELTRFVREALSRGIPRAEIERALGEAGWHREQVAKALGGFAEVAFPLPVPRPVHHLSAGEAFLYLVLFSALGTAAFSVTEIFFNLIEVLFYDPSSAPPVDHQSWAQGLRWTVARVVIAYPVFLLAAHSTARALRRDPAERSSPIRRWLTSIAMFLAVSVIIGDFVTLVAYVLGGETTVRFLLKVVVVAAIAGAILGYYLWDMRQETRRPAVANALLVVATLVALAAIGVGVWMMGTPSEQAALRTDERRISELREIESAVSVYYQRNAQLPESLPALAEALGTALVTRDPESGTPYEYQPGTGKSFSLCASFARPSESVGRDGSFTHAAGHQCFAREAVEKKPGS
jgi:hypothetical protein